MYMYVQEYFVKKLTKTPTVRSFSLNSTVLIDGAIALTVAGHGLEERNGDAKLTSEAAVQVCGADVKMEKQRELPLRVTSGARSCDHSAMPGY